MSNTKELQLCRSQSKDYVRVKAVVLLVLGEDTVCEAVLLSQMVIIEMRIHGSFHIR